MGLIDGVTDTVVGAGEAALDVPADAVNATTGTGENLGWFGTIDRTLDPRGISEEEAAEPTAETTGLSGFFAGATGAATQAGADIGAVTTDPLLAGLGFDVPDEQNQQQSGSDDPTEEEAIGGASLALLALAGLAGGYLLLGGGA